MTVDWQAVRAEFPSLEGWTFLNTATFGQLPRRVTAAVAEHFARRDAQACSDFLDWFTDADGIRRQVGELIHAGEEDIAFFPTSSAALSLLLGGLDWRPGDRVVTFQDEFPNNLYYPSLLASRGAEFVETAWEGFYEAVTPNTRLVLLSSVNYTNGFRAPLEEIAAFLRERAVMLYIDGTQSVGALQFDVARIRPAMLAVNGYKWLLSPTGAAFAYVEPALRARLQPNVVGWRSHVGWRNVDQLHHGVPEFATKAEKYEGGMLSFPALYGMGASVGLMLEIGLRAIEQRVHELSAKMKAMLDGLGARLIGVGSPHYDSPIAAARWEGVDTSRLARQLKERRVLVSARHGNLRVSVHFYNNEDDLARLGDELRALL